MTPKSLDLNSLQNWRTTIWLIIGHLQSNVPQNTNLQNRTSIWPDLLLRLMAHFPPWPHPAPDAHTRGLDGPLFWLSRLVFYQLLTPVTSPSLNLMCTLCLFCSHLDPLSLLNLSSSSLSVSPCFNIIFFWQLNHPRPYLWLCFWFFSEQTVKWWLVFIHRTYWAQIIFPATYLPLPILKTHSLPQLNWLTRSSNLPWTFVHVVPFARKSFLPISHTCQNQTHWSQIARIMLYITFKIITRLKVCFPSDLTILFMSFIL